MLKRAIEIINSIVAYYVSKLKINFLGLILVTTITLIFSFNTLSQQPNLGITEEFALFTSSGAVSNSGTSDIEGNVGAQTGAISGFGSPTTHNGNIESANAITTQCAFDTQALYDELFTRPQTVFGHAPAFGSGETVFPGVYAEAGAGSVLLNLTLDAQGDPCAIFIFKFGGAFNTGASTNIILTNGAQSSNVFWISAGAISMAAGTNMSGTLISSPGAVSMASGGKLEGRLLSTTGAIAVDMVKIVAKRITTWNGSVDSDWFNNINWSNNIPNSSSEVIIPSGVVNMPIINGTNAAFLDIKIESSATLEISGTNRIDVYGNMDIQGSLITNTSTINFTGNCLPKTINTNGIARLHSVIVNTTSNVQVIGGLWELRGVMTIKSGSFITNDSLTVISDASGTGSIGEITGVGIIGKITMQRHIDSGETYWRFFSSAVQGAQISDYHDDFITAGYPGSAFPNFGWVSIYNYDETLGSGLGYVPVSNSNQPLQAGEGFMVWSGDTITGTQPFNVDLFGVPNQGDVVIPITYTNTGSTTEDGWNLIGNPYPSTIDWESSDWTKNNIANATYILNPDSEQYATYVNGASVNGGSRYIASQQAFWVVTTGIGPSLIGREGVKSNDDQPFLKSGTISPGVKISINGLGMSDECIIRDVDNSNDSFEKEYDAYKFYGGSGNYPFISLINTIGEDLVVHSFDKEFQEWSIPIKITVYQNGFYDLIFNNIYELDVPCLKLEDTYTGQMYSVYEDEPINIELSDTTTLPRFILHIGRNYEHYTNSVLCNGDNNGYIEIDLNDSSIINYTLSSLDSFNGNGSGNPLIIDNLEAGTYDVQLPSIQNLCGVNEFTLIIPSVAPLNLISEIENEIELDGKINVYVYGGVPPYTYLWDNGASTPTIENLSAGIYTLTITDANDCKLTSYQEIKSIFEITNSHETDLDLSFFYNNGIVTVTNFNTQGKQDIVIYSADGKIVHNQPLDLSTNNFSYSVNELSIGMYIITNSTYSFTEKFFVSR